jgi:hypothetical protein
MANQTNKGTNMGDNREKMANQTNKGTNMGDNREKLANQTNKGTNMGDNREKLAKLELQFIKNNLRKELLSYQNHCVENNQEKYIYKKISSSTKNKLDNEQNNFVEFY